MSRRRRSEERESEDEAPTVKVTRRSRRRARRRKEELGGPYDDDGRGLRLTRRGRLVVALTILVILLGLTIVPYLYAQSIGLMGEGDPGPKISVEIPAGTSGGEVGEILRDRDIIDSTLGWRIASYLEGGAEDIQAGRYEIRTGLTPRDALDALEEGPIVKFVTVTFPEGSWLTDFAAAVGEETHIRERKFLGLANGGEVRSRYQPRSVDKLEGLLFPSTYQVAETDDAGSLLERLLGELEKRVGALDFSAVRKLGYGKYEAITVASMVEAEARVDSDRAKIARVIYNRLEAGEILGIDATVIYALGEHKTSLTQSDLQIDSPYNTRKYAGLPPTPIGAPGEASLRAAAQPAEGDWFYYVLADCKGRHAFSTTEEQFLEDKAAYQELSC
ncbi:MAG: endolytic transglycosylase MltG [Actinomycetota bacterium]